MDEAVICALVLQELGKCPDLGDGEFPARSGSPVGGHAAQAGR